MKMIEIEKKDFEAVVEDVVAAKDLRLIIEKSLKNHNHYRIIIADISKGSKSRNFRLVKEISKNRKISERFIVDQAKSVISFFNPGGDEADLEDYYRILECSQDSDDEVIRSNWIKLMKLYHPDKIGEAGSEKTKKINEAYNILIDPISRDKYDRSYFPDIPIKIKNLNYIQFKNKRFLSVMTSLFLLVPVFYIYRSFTGPDVNDLNIKRFEKQVKSADLNDTSSDIKSIEIANNKSIGTEGNEIDVSSDNVIVEQQDIDSVKDEVSGVKEENIVVLRDFDEIDAQAIAQKPNLVDEIEVAEEGMEIVYDPKIALDRNDDDRINEEIYVEQEIEIKKEEIKTDNSTVIKDSQKYIVKKGDSLWLLSDKFDIPIKEIKNQNSLNRNTIKPGDTLILSKSYENADVEKLSDIKVNPDTYNDLNNTDNKISTASSKKLVDVVRTSNKKSGIKKNKVNKIANIKDLELSSIKGSDINTPNKSSIYTAISDYIFAYKNRDMKKLGTLFDVNAKENGVSIDEVFKMYKKNFKVLDIVAYDIKFNKVYLDKRKATVDGDFIISFTNINEDVYKKSYGDINWKLTWNDNSWLINEIRYNVTNTKVGDDFNKRY